MKKINPICKNCKLFDGRSSTCRVTILYEGEQLHLPVDPQDHCFFEQNYFDPVTKKIEDFNEIQQVRFWVEDEKGLKTDKNGTVKFEAPTGFFGDA